MSYRAPLIVGIFWWLRLPLALVFAGSVSPTPWQQSRRWGWIPFAPVVAVAVAMLIYPPTIELVVCTVD